MIDSPGPQDYVPIHAKSTTRQAGDKMPFGVNTLRFTVPDFGVPGAGTYKLPDSCVVH